MVIEDEENESDLNQDYLFENAEVHINVRPRQPLTFTRFTYVLDRLKDAQTRSQLKDDLVEHLWQVKGDDDEE